MDQREDSGSNIVGGRFSDVVSEEEGSSVSLNTETISPRGENRAAVLHQGESSSASVIEGGANTLSDSGSDSEDDSASDLDSPGILSSDDSSFDEESLERTRHGAFQDWCDGPYTFQPGTAHVMFLNVECNTTLTAKVGDKSYERNFVPTWWEGSNRRLWLRAHEGGLICLVCRHFGKIPGSWNGAWAFKPFSSLQRAKKSISDHEKTHVHVTALAMYMDRKRNRSVHEVMLAVSEANKMNNRQYMLCLINTFLYMIKKGLPVNAQFKELVDFQIANGNKILKTASERLGVNCQYKSKRFLEDIFEATTEYMNQKLSKLVSKAPFISVSADESQDISHTENLAVCFRFLDGSNVRECMAGLVSVDDLQGEAVGMKIIDFLRGFEERENVSLPRIVSQSYDGASNMKHVAAKVIQSHRDPHAAYLHCSSHVLNLAGKDSCKESSCLKEVIDFAHDIYSYFVPQMYGATVRNRALDHAFDLCGQTVRKPLKECDTRWDSQFESTTRVSEIYTALLIALNDLAEQKRCPIAKGFCAKMIKSSFMLGCFYVPQVLDVLVRMNKVLQSNDYEISMLSETFDACIRDLQATLKYPCWDSYFETMSQLTKYGISFKHVEKATSASKKLIMPNLDETRFSLVFDKSLMESLISGTLDDDMESFLAAMYNILFCEDFQPELVDDVISTYVKIRSEDIVSRPPPQSRRKKCTADSKSFPCEEKKQRSLLLLKRDLEQHLPQGLKKLRSAVRQGKSFDECTNGSLPRSLVDMVKYTSDMHLRVNTAVWIQQEGKSITDALINCLENRFTHDSRKLFTSARVLSPSYAAKKEIGSLLEEITPLLDFYGERQSSTYTGKSGKVYEVTRAPVIDREACLQQLPLFFNELTHLSQTSSHPASTLLETLPYLLTQEPRFPECIKLSQMVLTWFVGNASVERSFSSMKRVKTPLRSKLTTKKVECYMRWNTNEIEQSDDVANEILNIWYNQTPRNINI